MMKMNIKMDLHMHSNQSDDGEYSGTQLMEMCKQAGLNAVAIADHNSVEAIEEAHEAALKLGLDLIPAIEVDCTIHDTELHVLGYGIDYHDPAFMELTLGLRKQEQDSAQLRLDLVKRLGLYIDEEKAFALSHHGCITGEIIAEVALQDERNHACLKNYLPGGSRSDNPYVNFYWDYCAQGKPAYVKINFMSLQEAIAMIQHAGGIPVLAHPGNNTKEQVDLLDEIFAQGVQGIEAYSSYHTSKQISFYLAYAKANKLFVTAGSDFHGKTKPAIQLGETGCENTTDLYTELQWNLLHDR